MTQLIRGEYQSTWFHVMTRGIRGANIFSAKEDYEAFVRVLAKTSEACDAQIAAYCLMPNRYHILIQTEEDNLARCVRHINQNYTRLFNQLHRGRGRLFQRRHRFVLLRDDRYLPDLMRYIHRIPLLEGMVEKLDQYRWSSHRGYLSQARKWHWLSKESILSILGQDQTEQLKLYRRFVA